MITKELYFAEREKLINDYEKIEKIEELYSKILLNDILMPVAENIYKDFTESPLKLLPFWKNYPPEQRGRQPIGNSIPWLELGEKTIGSNIIGKLSNHFPDITFPGLPTGGDIRFATDNVYIHLDIKLTGPNDNPDEVVVPPNQVSGDGKNWDDGILNSNFPIVYQSGSKAGQLNYHFQPKLPPFYILDGKTYLCLTFFLEAIYNVDGFGDHPLKHFELSCVPNGLIMFDGYSYSQKKGLFIAGKDDNTKGEDTKRVRIRLTPLSQINKWRSVIVYKDEEIWKSKER